MNTLISYLYRDMSNNKTQNWVIVAGEFTPQQLKDIKTCLSYGEFFIPRQIGLPEERPGKWDEQEDHCWFEIDPETCFETVEYNPTIAITADQLYVNFMTAKDNWQDSKYSDPDEPGVTVQQITIPVAAHEYLKALRIARRVDSPVAIAAAANIPYDKYQSIESGENHPTEDQLRAIASALHLDETETAKLYDLFGKSWNQFGIPLDIIQYIQNNPNGIDKIRKLIADDTNQN